MDKKLIIDNIQTIGREIKFLKLKERERHFSLLEHNPDAIFLIDIQGNFLYMNPVARLMTGYEQQYPQKATFLSLVLARDKDKVEQLIKQTCTGQAQIAEFTVQHKKSGDYVELRVKTVPIIIEERTIELYIIAHDITDHKRAQEELRKIQLELRETLENQQGFIFKFKEENGRFIHTFCSGMGIPAEGIIGKELSDFIPKEIATWKETFYRRAWEGEENVTYEGRDRGIVYLASLKPVKKEGQVVEVIASCIEITERKQMEEAVKESEAKYRLLAEHMTDIIVLMDKDGLVHYASPSLYSILGYSIASDHPQPPPFELVHAEDQQYIFQQFRQIIDQKQPTNVEFRFKHVQDHWIIFEASGMPVIGESGEVEKIVVSLRDITKRKQTEEKLEEERLRAGELLLMSEKFSVVSQLAAGIAHEIRNPLTALKGFVQLLKHNNQSNPKYIEIMSKEIDRINFIVSEFLALAKPKVIQFEKKNVADLIHNVITLLNTQAIMNNVQISTKIPKDLPLITCDENQLKQVFINILKNSIEAMPQGGMIRIEVKRQENYVILLFKDKGVGISKERLARLGEPFYSTKEKGTGLGMMVSYKIIEEHHGEINVQSKVNQGTTVEVILPIERI